MRTRAILIDRLGPPEQLSEREVELPDPQPDEVHLAVEACGVNFADLMMRLGLYSTVPPRPFSPGFEVAGRVARAGSKVRDLREGDRVMALLRYGGYARDVIVPARNAMPWPGELNAAEAAALPVVFLTAWMCLHRTGHARRGETVLVLGAGGGVGTAAVQLARRAGLRTLGTAGSERKRRYVVDTLGAEACFDSRGAWEKEVRRHVGDSGLDLALDPVGAEATRACRRLLGPLGRLVFYGMSEAAPGMRRDWLRAAWAWLRTPRFHPLSLIEPNQSVHGVHLLHLGRKEDVLLEAYRDMLGDFSTGRLFPVLDRVFPLTREGAAGAHAHLHARRNLGKVVLVHPAAMGHELTNPS